MSNISKDNARAISEKIMDKAGAIPGLLHAILPAFLDGKLGDTEQFMKYCGVEPKGRDLWDAFEASEYKEPYDFIVDHANIN